jgi:replicative DNA helicase
VRNEEVGQALVPAKGGTGTRLRPRDRRIAVRSGLLDLIVVGYLQLMGAEHLTGNRATERRLPRAGSSRSRERSIWPVIAVSQLDGGIELRPGDK